ncbi:tripartite tricarboxylate transporter TctB family protein [Mesorhizobium sp. PUT5]|uniref:tripartite tricarboxylate transporter TctB family protein n=1 Tax=Mesorhizobium sp. PUT5 TaxID=3454629 RepID=UPI003FA4BF24
MTIVLLGRQSATAYEVFGRGMRHPRIDYPDLIGGALLMTLGLALAIYSMAHYRLGTVSRMGPGMYPVAIGVLLTFLGLCIAAPALVRGHRAVPVLDFRPICCSLGGIAVFAVMVVPFGLVPAVAASTSVSSLGDNKLGAVGIAALAAGLSVLAALIFKVALALPIPLWNWPF